MKPIFIPMISNQPLSIDETYEGGYGFVYIVESEGNRFALKTMKWESGISKEDFVHEVELFASVADHPNIAKIMDVSWFDGNPFIVMPYYPKSLTDYVRPGQGIDSDEVAEILRPIADALLYIHQSVGIVHLDLKPSNILISQKNEVLVADFGISRILPKPGPDGICRKIFVSGGTGTLAYMSPEQILGGMLGPETDMFALGAITFELLTGSHPFLSDTFEGTARNILTRSPSFGIRKRLSIPSNLRTITLACLSKDPSKRPTAEKFLRVLRGKSYATKQSSPSIDLSRQLGKAAALAGIGQKKEAKEILEACVVENPTVVTAHIHLAVICFDLGEMDQALSTAKRALSLIRWLPSEKETIGTLLTNLSLYYLSIDPRQTVTLARSAVRFDPADWQALGNLAEGCRLLGMEGGEKEHLDEGLEAVERALAINPSDHKLQTTHGGILFARGELNKAWGIVKNLINTIGGDYLPLRMLLINILIEDGQIDAAKEWLEPMRDYEPLAGVISTVDKRIARLRLK